MRRTIRINEDQAKALYEKDNELRDTLLHGFSDEELGIKPKPFTWYDLEEVLGCFVGVVDSCVSYPITYNTRDLHRNIFPTKTDAKSARAKAMLLQLAKHYNDGETEEEWIDWGDKRQKKYYATYSHKLHKVLFFPNVSIYGGSIYFKRFEDLKKCVADNRELWEEYFKL